MKNRIFWFLILVFVIFWVLLYFMFKQEQAKNNIETWTWINSWSLEEKVVFSKISSSWNIETSENKIENLREKASNFAYFRIWENKFYFNVSGEKLELKVWEKNIWFFDLVLAHEIKVSEIFWLTKTFLIELKDKKIIYSLENDILKEFETKLDITYWKFSNWNFVFFSKDKWTFVLFKEKSDLEFFPIFSDFVFYKSWYIWIIWREDSERKSRFEIESSKNIVLYFDPKTKEKKVIFELDFQPIKIFEKDEKIFLQTPNGEYFSIENFLKK